MLSDLGADVVKVEPPDGDVTRLWGAKIHGVSGYFNQQNAGKRGICVDLSVPEGVELIKALAARADILIENFRPDVMGRLGLGYPVLRALNPALIMLSISGFGAAGPETRRAAYAPIIHGESGLLARQARFSQGRLVDLPVSAADMNASLHGLVGVLAALHLRHATGLGQHIDIAMIDATLVTDDHLHAVLDDAEEADTPRSEVWQSVAGPLVISGDFRHLWRQLNEIEGVPDPTPPGADLGGKIAARRAAFGRFLTETCTDRASVIAALDRMNLAWGDVRDSRAALDLPTVRHRGTITRVDDRGGSTRRITQSPYRYSDAEARVRGGAPHQGEHNAAVLADWLGADEGAVARWAPALREAGQSAAGGR
jgi:crotonobetainyl-CoA:carnitine CoA-transferase CaiB-like acyl-CoA transferase